MRLGGTRGTWTVLVFMAADEDHGVFTNDAIDKELDAIEDAVGLHHEARIVVLADTRDSKGFRCFGENGRLERQPLRREPVASSLAEIVNFLKLGRNRHRSDHYLVLFWGHGFGPAGLRYERRSVGPRTLREALAKGFGLFHWADIVTFMSCHMSTIELAYELAEWRLLRLPITKVADFVVASEGTVKPKHAFPYDELFRALLDADHSPITVGKRLVDILGTKYEAPFSLLEVSSSWGVRDALTAVADVLVATNPFVTRHPLPDPLRQAIHEALGKAETDEAALLDLVRLGRNLAAISGDTLGANGDGSTSQQARIAGQQLVQAVEGRFVLHTGPRGAGAQQLNGVSAYCPPHHNSNSLVRRMVDMTDYRQLGLSKWQLLHKSWVDVVSLARE